MRAADKALYVAKNEGRDRWHVPGADQEVAR
jgi:PleD family two-component response regulator